MPELATDLTPADDDERLEQAESVVRDFVGWHIAPVRTDAVETFDGLCGRERVYLRTLQLTAITDVFVVGVASTFNVAHYQIDTDQGWVQPVAGRTWPTGSSGRVTVEYSHGYATVPPAVTRAVQAIAAQGVSNPGALTRIKTGPFEEQYGSGGSAGGGSSVAGVLAPYVLPLV
jgi:hypothetical protein